MITVRINLMARPGKQNELMQAIGELKDKVASERGCNACDVYQNPENRDAFVVLEQWENEKLARAHLDSENLAVLVGAGSVLSQDVNVSLTKEPSVTKLEQIFKKRVLKNGEK